MILYDPGHWNVAFALTLHGSVFPKAFCWAFPCALMAGLMHYIFHQDEAWAAVASAGATGATVLSGFSFIFGFSIVSFWLKRNTGSASPIVLFR